MNRVNPNLGLQNSGRWSLYTGGLYIQLNYSEKSIGGTRRRSLYAGGLFMQVVFSTGSTVYYYPVCAFLQAEMRVCYKNFLSYYYYNKLLQILYYTIDLH